MDAFERATLCDACGRESCEDHLPPELPNAGGAKIIPPSPAAFALSLDELRGYQFPPRRPILMRGDVPIIREGHLGEIFAERGIGKTWFLQSLALVSASTAQVLGFHATEPCRVLYIDGEMDAHDIQARFASLERMLEIKPGAPITVLAADWQENYLPRLDTPEGQAFVEPYVDATDLIVLDNRSCLFDSEGEKDPTAWQPAQDWLLSLRRRGKAVLMAHHANRQGGARGHSKSEDPLNLIIKLARPDDYSADQGSRFHVTFEKSRGAYGAAIAPFTARLTPEGWQTESSGSTSTGSRLLEHIRLAEAAAEPVKSATAAIRAAGINRQNGLKAWADLVKSGAILKHPAGGFRAA